MCNQVWSFYRGVGKFVTKIQITFPNCADFNLCLHSYTFPSKTELKVIGHHNIHTVYVRNIHTVYVRLKVIEHFVGRLSDRYFKA
jgi:hypothetical protein